MRMTHLSKIVTMAAARLRQGLAGKTLLCMGTLNFDTEGFRGRIVAEWISGIPLCLNQSYKEARIWIL